MPQGLGLRQEQIFRIASESNVVDRESRDRLAVVVRQFLASELTAFAFDEQLQAFDDSSDSAVRFVAEVAWGFYDDLQDHLVVLTKSQWDFFQRLLLLLESDRGIHKVGSRRWSFSQWIALAALLGFGGLVFQLGWGYHLVLTTVPFGVVSMGISRMRGKPSVEDSLDQSIYPFSSFSDLRSASRAATFKKSRYPLHMQTRAIRSPWMNALNLVPVYGAWLFLSPIPLVYQLWPRWETQVRVIAG